MTFISADLLIRQHMYMCILDYQFSVILTTYRDINVMKRSRRREKPLSSVESSSLMCLIYKCACFFACVNIAVLQMKLVINTDVCVIRPVLQPINKQFNYYLALLES